MPWCDQCDRFWNPNTVHDDGSCPGCGRRLARPATIRKTRRGKGISADALTVGAHDTPVDDPASSDGDEEDAGTPWHFKVLLVALVLYLTWRLVQGIMWVGHRL